MFVLKWKELRIKITKVWNAGAVMVKNVLKIQLALKRIRVKKYIINFKFISLKLVMNIDK